jgi:hypothetical protein
MEATFSQICFYCGDGFFPEWTSALLAPLAKNTDRARRAKPQVVHVQINQFLHAHSGVVEQALHSGVPLSTQRPGINGGEAGEVRPERAASEVNERAFFFVPIFGYKMAMLYN